MNNKLLTIIGLTCITMFSATIGYAHQYDILEAGKAKDAVDKKIILDNFLTDDIKQATDYECNVFENADIKATYEIEYKWNNSFTLYETNNSYSERDYVKTAFNNNVFALVNKQTALTRATVSHLILKVQNKTEREVVLDLSRSNIQINGYKGGPLKSNEFYKNLTDKGGWLIKLKPKENKEVKLYLDRGLNDYIDLNKQLMGSYILNVNGKYLSFILSGMVNSSKLHWKADTNIDRNKAKYVPTPLKDQVRSDSGIRVTKKESVPDWAL